jgi:predicted alpha/beta superfamily hydrolase
MSPSVWWDNQAIVQMIHRLPNKLPLRIWVDTGTREEGWQRARALRDALVEKGWPIGRDFQYIEVEGADHSEAAWSQRVEPALRFLFPPVRHK